MKKNKFKNKKLSAAIALVLTILIAATMITALPVAFGQTEAVVSEGAAAFVIPNVVGINQRVFIEGIINPPPKQTVNHVYTIQAPNGTQIIKQVPSFDPIGGKESNFYFTPDATGTWRVRIGWPGNAQFTGANSSYVSFTVQSTPTPALTKWDAQAWACSMPKNVVGLGQPVFLLGWITPAREMSSALFWSLTFTITDPDGKTTTVFKPNTDSPGTVNTVITASKLGNWSVKLSWPGDELHKAAESPIWTWTVQQDPVEASFTDVNKVPLPSGPWSWPISAENREWYQISGAWPYDTDSSPNFDMSGTQYNAYSTMPETAHILWKKQVSIGGLAGGDQGWMSSQGSYFFSPSVAAQGRIYTSTIENYLLDGTNVGPHHVLWCYNQFTGELIYRRDIGGTGSAGHPGSGVSAASLYLEIQATAGEVDPTITARDPAAFSLWLMGTGLWEINPLTGDTLYYWEGAPSGYPYNGYYYLTSYNGTSGKSQSGVVTKWDCRNKQSIWAKPISGISNIGDGVIVQRAASSGMIPNGLTVNIWNATTGDVIALGPDLGEYMPAGSYTIAYGLTHRLGSDLRLHGISLKTGQVVWKTQAMESPWATFGMYWSAAAYNIFYFGSYDGYLYAFNATDGSTIWKHFFGYTSQTAAGVYIPWAGGWVADGKIIVATCEHSPAVPYPKGNYLVCLDALTGKEIWAINGFQGQTRAAAAGISSGMFWFGNQYDGCVYNFGKGESATTVSAPTISVTLGTSVLIQGTVTDQSPGLKNTPAISDNSMSAWMEYKYTQNQAFPMNATGVPVFVQAVSPNGTIIDIGSTTSDIMGNYRCAWNPPTAGTYTILASFPGSGSYFASSAECGLLVGPASATPIVTPTSILTPSPIVTPTVAPTPTPTTPQGPGGIPASTMYAVSAAIVIIVIVAVAALVLRKRK